MPARWYRSLYWRIALGFVLCLAVMLAVQGLLLIFVASRSGPTLPGVTPARFARGVAQDLSQALEQDANLDIGAFLRDQYGREAHPLVVLLADGREFTNGAGAAPEAMLAGARDRLRRSSGERFDRRRGPPPGMTGPPDGSGFPGGPGGRRGPPRGPRDADDEDGPPFGGRGGLVRPTRPVPIIVRDQLAGVVIVPPRAPFTFLLARYAPTIALVSVGALVLGALLTTLLVFGPARRRLRALEQAATRFGAGDRSARAPTQGGDEVAAVATAFNVMADDLAARAQALETSDRVRRQLLADVSHELTTPVTAMRGYLETLSMPDFALDDATKARYLGIVTDETARLERIIGDLLELARLEGGGGTLAVGEVAIADLFARVCARHERTAAAAGVTFAIRIDPDAHAVAGDADRLEQALQNLAANALRYAPAGSVVELTAQRTGDHLALQVIDHGAGIAAEHLPHLFDRFYKAEASRVARPRDVSGTTTHGSGLGLSIVKAITERHGGTVSVESTAGRTLFRLRVPAWRTADGATGRPGE